MKTVEMIFAKYKRHVYEVINEIKPRYAIFMLSSKHVIHFPFLLVESHMIDGKKKKNNACPKRGSVSRT